MVTCQVAVVLVSLVLAMFLGGCAAQPISPSAGAGTDGANGMAGRSSDGAGVMADSAARPRLSDFVAHDDIRDVHFDFDSYQIRPMDAKILDASMQWLKARPDSQLVIEGHADERGTNEYNVSLGERRAKASMNYLMSHGISASRIIVTSYGEERGVCHEKNERCWSKNRRAHFLVKSR